MSCLTFLFNRRSRPDAVALLSPRFELFSEAAGVGDEMLRSDAGTVRLKPDSARVEQSTGAGDQRCQPRQAEGPSTTWPAETAAAERAEVSPASAF